MHFSEEFLHALNNWQKGWREDLGTKDSLAENLLHHCETLPKTFKTVQGPCYRKRFLHQGELIEIIMADNKNEGIASWTTDEKYAERFKGLIKTGFVTGAIFKTNPDPEDVILNINDLWANNDFRLSVDKLSNQDVNKTAALIHFKNTQSEVILKTHLRGSDIIALTGIASPFDDLCDQAGIPESERDNIFKKLIESGEYIEEPRYTPPGGAQAAIKRTIEKFHRRILELSGDIKQ